VAFTDLLETLRNPPNTLAKLSHIPGLYIVGGYLRDAWYGLGSTDYDFATSQPFQETADAVASALNAKPFLLGQRHGTIRLAYNDGWLDISVLEGGSTKRDIERRDYTVNTLAVEVSRLGQGIAASDVHAHSSAFDDLENRTLRMVAKDNIQSDPVRILRGYRHCAKLGLQPDEQTRSAWKELAGRLNDSAPERLREELLSWFSDRNPLTQILTWCADDSVLWELFPALSNTVGCEQNAYHHADVWSHTMEAIAALDELAHSLPEQLSQFQYMFENELSRPISGMANGLGLLRLALLLHDIGKPDARDVQPDGRITFYKHQQIGEEIIAPELERLKFSNNESAFITLIVREHLRLGYYSSDKSITSKLAYRFIRAMGESVPLAILHSLADCMATKGPLSDGGFELHANTAAGILKHFFAQDSVASPPVLLSGREIMAKLEIAPGPRVGKVKHAMLEATAVGEIETKEQALEFVVAFSTKGRLNSGHNSNKDCRQIEKD